MADLSNERIEKLLAKATPGPWLREAQGIYADNGYKLIASVKSHESGIHWPTTEANGNIMALAPDLAREVLALRAEVARLREALTPSESTKAAYIGEFHFSKSFTDADGNDQSLRCSTPWTTIKEIMAAIRARAALMPAPEASDTRDQPGVSHD